MANAFEKWCQETSEVVDDWSDREKKFVLWLLIDYYKEGLERDIKFVPKDIPQYARMVMMKNHINVCEEIREALCYEIF